MRSWLNIVHVGLMAVLVVLLVAVWSSGLDARSDVLAPAEGPVAQD